MGSVPVYITSSAEPYRHKRFEGLALPSRALVLSEATPIVLRPEEGQVMIGTQLLPASRIVESDWRDEDHDGFRGRFTVEGRQWTYDIMIYADRVEVQKWFTEIEDECPSYGGDVFGFTRVGAFARFMVEELIPDCLAALEDKAT